MLVYRYELDGIGPYRTENKKVQDLSDEICSAHCSWKHPERWPTIGKDTNYAGCGLGYYCACPSRSSLATWFNRYNRRLKAAGFKIHVYEVKDYIMGNSGKQLAFRRDTARLIQIL